VPDLESTAKKWLRGEISLAAIPRWTDLTTAWDHLAVRAEDDKKAAETLRAHSRHWENLLRNTHEPQRLTWLRAAEAAHAAANDQQGQANTLKAIGDVQAFQKDNPEALDHYKQALKLFDTVGDRLGQANTLGAMGGLALVQGEREKAENLIEEAVDLFEDIGSRYGIGALWNRSGVALLRADRLEEARPWLERSAAYFHDIGMPEQAAPSERALATIDETE